MMSFPALLLDLLLLMFVTSQVMAQQNWNAWQRRIRRDDEWSSWRPPWENYDNSVVVRTLYGDVRGFTVPWHTDDLDWDPNWEEHPPWFTRRVNCFLGIPYAAPPVGQYRFRKPERPRWSDDPRGWDATYFRHACPQSVDEIRVDIPDYPAQNISEDCLYMNIFAPNLTYYRGPNQQYPVLVWFHSGDFVSGSAQTEPGHVLATREIVVVTFNYRLGALGYLTTHDEHGVGNWGLSDMQMALEFVKENIKAFQGDPDRITIGGDTAGASAVGFMLLSENTRDKGFYHQCIMMSGTDLSRSAFLNPYWGPREYAQEMGDTLGCYAQDTYRMMNCLRDNTSITWQMILETQHNMRAKDGQLGVIFAPTQDGGYFQQDPNFPQVPMLRLPPVDFRLREAFARVPCIIGINTQDGVKKANETIPNLQRGLYRSELQEFITDLLRDWNIQEMFIERVVEAVEFQYTYWPDPENITARQQEFINLVTDIEVGVAMDRALKFASDFTPQWMYQFNYNSWNNWLPEWMGVGFSQAVPYVFGVPFMNETVLNETELEPRQFYDYEDRNMSDWMMYMWTNFIRDGHPTPNITRNITWEPFNFYNLSYLLIDHHSNIWGRYRQDKYSFWHEYLPEIAKQEFYYATPTPQGYEYVVATGFMSTLCIILLCSLAFIIFALWYQKQQKDLEDEFSSTRRTRGGNAVGNDRESMDFLELAKHYRAGSSVTSASTRKTGTFDTSPQYQKARTFSPSVSDDEYFTPSPTVYPSGSKPRLPPGASSDWTGAPPSREAASSDWTGAPPSREAVSDRSRTQTRHQGRNTNVSSAQRYNEPQNRQLNLSPPVEYFTQPNPYRQNVSRHQGHSVV